MFSIGQEVECICDNWDWEHGPHRSLTKPRLPSVGEHVTVADISKPYHPQCNEDFLFFSEYGGKIGFLASFFRPIQKKKTDISVFTEMLKKVPEHV